MILCCTANASYRNVPCPVVDTERTTIAIDSSTAFKRNAVKFGNMLRKTNSVTLLLQTGNGTLAYCPIFVDSLMRDVEQYRTDAQSDLCDCHLGKNYLAVDVEIAPETQFESVLVKIRRGNATRVSDAEKSARENLREPGTSVSNGVPGAAMSVVERIALRKRRRLDESRKYVNCDFILGSAAEVKRLWSVAKNILKDNRKSMTQLLLEAITVFEGQELLLGG